MATLNHTFEFEDGEEPFSSLDLNKIAEESADSAFDVYNIWEIIATFIKFGLCVGSLGASLFLIYVFIKFKNLRKGSNVYFLYFSICNIIDMLFIPLYSLIHELVLFKLTGHLPLCIIYQLNAVIISLEICLIASIAIDWYLVIINNKLVDNYERFQKILIICINSVFTLLFLMLTIDCFLDFSTYIDYSGLIIYTMSLLIIVIINCLVYRKQLTNDQLKSKYLLIISTYMLSTSLPSFIIFLIWAFIPPENNIGLIIFLDILERFSEFFVYSTAIVVVYLLGYYNKYYKMAYDSILKRSVKTYQQDNLDESVHNEATTTNQATTTSNIMVDC